MHLTAWHESIDTASLGRITAVNDDVLTPDGTDRHFVPDEYNYLRAAFAGGPNITRAQIVTPSLDVRRYNLEVIPRNQGDLSIDLTHPQLYIPREPIELIPGESIEAQIAEEGATTANLVLAWLGPRELPPMPNGNIRMVRATGTTTLTADTWTSVTLTLDTSLEPGRYTVVGFLPISANVSAARLILPGQVWRPGVIGLPGAEDAAVDVDMERIDHLMWYNMGEFVHSQIPQCQFLADTADTAQTVFLYLVRSGEN